MLRFLLTAGVSSLVAQTASASTVRTPPAVVESVSTTPSGDTEFVLGGVRLHGDGACENKFIVAAGDARGAEKVAILLDAELNSTPVEVIFYFEPGQCAQLADEVGKAAGS